MLNKFIKTLTAAALIFTISVPTVFAAPVNMTLTYDGKNHNYSAEAISLLINGQPAENLSMPPVILNSRTYVPSREVFEPLGAAIDWKANTKEIYIGYNGNLIIMRADAITADVNGKTVSLENPAKIINDKLMIPVRFVSEELGIPVTWDGDKRIVSVGEHGVPAADKTETPAASEDTTANADTTPAPAVTAPPAPVQTPPVQTAPVSNGMSTDMSSNALSEIQGGDITVKSVTASVNVFTVLADGQFTKVEKQLLAENKLVLDIYNASNGLSSTYTPDFSGVSAVRNSQFSSNPNITRIVFDLVGANKFTVAFSADRKSISVVFEQNTVKGINYLMQGQNDVINITSTLTPNIKTTRLFSPDRLVFDVLAATNEAAPGDIQANGAIAKTIRTSQFDQTTTRIVVDISSSAQYSIATTATSAVITLSAPTYKNIQYSQEPYPLITLTNITGIAPSGIQHFDEYMSKRYTLTLPRNFSNELGYGTFEINDSTIGSITVKTGSSGNTEIEITEKSIYYFQVTQEGNNILIRPVAPNQAFKNVVFIDPGHGLQDPGATSFGYMEKNINLDIVLRLHALLEADPDFKVYASRIDDSYPANIDRALMANQAADLFVSVHQNSASSSSASGTEVLYKNHDGEVYPKLTSEAAARIIQSNLVQDMGTKDRGVVKRTDLAVLNGTKIPAVLVEVAFISNANDIAITSTAEGRQLAANSLYRSIKEIFNQYPTGR